MPSLFWTQRLHFGPSARAGHAMAYDGARQRVLLFGGRSVDGNLGDTWAWDGAFWTQVAETGPSARSGHAMAYDAERRQMLLCGGADDESRLSDTWVWDGVAWTQVAETGPAPRASHRMASDDFRGVVVLFGGEDGNTDLSDTWEWDGEVWTQREESGPAARRGHVMTFDVTNRRIVLFGGASAVGTLDDTWEWNGTLWRQIAEFGAPALVGAAMSYAGRSCLLFGGVDGTATTDLHGQQGTWEWDAQFWTEIQHFGPLGRSGHAMAPDVSRQRVVLFGGTLLSDSSTAAALLRDTWELPAREFLFASLQVSPSAIAIGDHFQVTVALREGHPSDFIVRLKATAQDQPVNIGVPAAISIPAGQVSRTVDVSLPRDVTTGRYTIAAIGVGAAHATTLNVDWAPAGTLRIVALLSNPPGDETQDEAVHIRNIGSAQVQLTQWALARSDEQERWLLNMADGVLEPGDIAVVTRNGRPMQLPNAGGEIFLINPENFVKDTKRYGPSASGELIQFD